MVGLLRRIAAPLFFALGLLARPAWAQISGNSSQTTTTTLANFNLTVGAIVAFVFMLLGLAAGLLLLVRFTRPRRPS